MNCKVFVEDAELVWVEGEVVKVNENNAEVIVEGSSTQSHRTISLENLQYQVKFFVCKFAF